MAEQTGIARDFRLMTLNAKHLRDRREVALEMTRLALGDLSAFARIIFRVFRFRIERMAGFASGVAEETEMAGVAKSGKTCLLRHRFVRQPFYLNVLAAGVDGVALHANAGRLRIGDLAENRVRLRRRGMAGKFRRRREPRDEERIGVSSGTVIKSETILRPIPAASRDPFFGRFGLSRGRRRRCGGRRGCGGAAGKKIAAATR